jgi:hypothetical protein
VKVSSIEMERKTYEYARHPILEPARTITIPIQIIDLVGTSIWPVVLFNPLQAMRLSRGSAR